MEGHDMNFTRTRKLSVTRRRRAPRCWCRGPRHGALYDICADRLARAERAWGEMLVRYVEWPALYCEDGEAGA
jgi:hypothetical protein